MMGKQIQLDEQLKRIPAKTRPTVKAAIKTVKQIAPKADEIAYNSQPPHGKSAMWKIVRYAEGGANVVGVGTFTNYAALFLYRGREAAACSRAAAKTRDSSPCTRRRTSKSRPSSGWFGRPSSSPASLPNGGHFDAIFDGTRTLVGVHLIAGMTGKGACQD